MVDSVRTVFILPRLMHRCIKLALVHDLAECLVGDLVPNEVTKDEKYKREKVVK